jgi:hypothetical protein
MIRPAAAAAVAVSALLAAAPALAQPAPAPAPAALPAPPSASAPPTAPLAIPEPHYVTQRLEIVVKAPAQRTWDRIGHFCDLAEWLPRPCTIVSGKDGELGAQRAFPGGTVEAIVAVTPLSYTYSFPVRVGVPYNMQHNTLQVQPIDAKTSRIVYAFFWDNSMVPEAQREAQMINRKALLGPALERMKAIVESGKPRP